MAPILSKPPPAAARRRGARVGFLVLFLAAVPLLAVIAAEKGWWQARLAPTYRLLAEADPRVVHAVAEPTGRRVALTIDDGPDAGTTPMILDVLKRHDAKATFFLISGRIPGNERVVKRIVVEGHEIGNHMTADRPSIDLDPRAFEHRFEQAHDVLARWQVPRWFRPASGWYDEAMIEAAERRGYRMALGRVYPLDAVVQAPALAARYIRWQAEPGEIIILHDAGSRGRNTVKTLALALPALKARGLEVVTLSRLTQPDWHLTAASRERRR